MNNSTDVRTLPGSEYGNTQKWDAGAMTYDLEKIARGFVLPPGQMATNSRPCETIPITLIPTMQSAICFNSSRSYFREIERKTRVDLVKKY